MKRRSHLAMAGLCLGAVITGCSGGSSGAEAGAAKGMIPQLVLPFEGPSTVGTLANYNPKSPDKAAATWLFEPLMVRNNLNCSITPWLATEYAWKGANTLVFTIRDGVSWSDGEPFTAQDVAFTLNLAKKYPAVDDAGLWNDFVGAPATSVTSSGNQVTIHFAGPSVPKFDNIIGIKILPEHVYASVGDPAKYVDTKPVSTGPFLVSSFNGRRLVLARNPHYWQADKIKVERLVLEGQYDAAGAALKLRAGQLDAYQGELPNPERTFVAADPAHNHFYYAPNGMNALEGNLTRPPFNDPKFREAIAYGLNKQAMSLKATYGIMQPASQSGLSQPNMKSWLPDAYAETNVLPYDTAKAKQLLDAAGYRQGADGRRTRPDGSPLTVNLTVQAGWIDYQAMADQISADLNALGVSTKVTASSPDSVDMMKKSGDFTAMVNYMAAGCSFVSGIGGTLASNQVPTSTLIMGNVERFRDPKVDQAVAALTSATTEAEQKAHLGVLVQSMMTQYPVIPLLYAPARLTYRTDHAVGWPSAENPYANPQDNMLVVMTHLRPA